MADRVPTFRRPSEVPTRAPASYQSESTEERRAAKAWYKRPRWRRLRLAFLRSHPLCDECSRHGRIVPAVDVHHLQDRRENPKLAFTTSNLQSLCKSCHAAKRRGINTGFR